MSARLSTPQHHWQAHSDTLQPCGARRHGKWRDRSKVHNQLAQALVDSSTCASSSSLVSLDSGCAAMCLGPCGHHSPKDLGSHETSRRAANGGKALRNLVLAAARGCSLRLAVANAFIPWTCHHYPGASSPPKRDIGYTPYSASPLVLLSSSLEGLKVCAREEHVGSMDIDVGCLHNTIPCETAGNGLSNGPVTKYALQIIAG